jgi:glutathione S-transferase
MAEVVLHHYPLSPFSEKIRRVLAYKEIPWRAVEQPIMAPKPDLTPLTGGYRRIPVLQIGADIYCDTALMVRVLERLYPARPTLPPTLAGAASVIA